MERYFLNDVEIPAPQGIDNLTRLKSRSRRYFSVLYRNAGYAQRVGNVTFADALSRRLLLEPYQVARVGANTRFRMEYDGVTEYEAFVDYLSFSKNRSGISCAFRDEVSLTTLESQSVTPYSVSTKTTVTLRTKRITGPATHTVGTTPTVQKAMPSAQSISHSLPLVRPEKAESSLPGQLLTVDSPLSNQPIYRNTTNDVQSLQLSGRVQMTFSASASTGARLVVLLYDPNGTSTEIRQAELLMTTSQKTVTYALLAGLVVQPGGWVVLGVRGDTVSKWSFTYGSDTVVTLESTNQAPESICRGLLAADLLAELVRRSSGGTLTFQSEYFTTGDGKDVFLTNGANLRGINRAIATSLQDVFDGLTASDPLALWIDGATVRLEPLATYLSSYAAVSWLDQEPISITCKPNATYLFNEVLTGYETWRSSGLLANDEINGSRRYLTSYQTVRQTLDLRAKTVIASGELIEEQRRKQFSDKTASANASDSNDDKLFVICTTLNRSGQRVNETREKTPYLTGVVDTETPYNVRLSPARSARRWAKILPIAPLVLESSEGNSTAKSRYGTEAWSSLGEGDYLPKLPKSLLGDELAIVVIPMSQIEFNNLGDWITVYDEGKPVTGLLMDATWQETEQGATCTMTLFL
ncbi:hypothetical protein [Spirosoma aerolatum]|uniref:hypothetical protein n=1 Tax=Spirosoma aerolatum TaxID=1211326 RepID=UPI0009ACA4FE|nr:hypothetical protein [Spirosoma aerolatum]